MTDSSLRFSLDFFPQVWYNGLRIMKGAYP